MITLVLGGARSGKSRHAEELALARPAPRFYLATAEARDDEMVERIREHRRRRAEAWITIEEPLELPAALALQLGWGLWLMPAALARHGADPASTLLIDCLTLWLSNLMGAGRDIEAATAELVAACDAVRGHAIFVSNEVGLGIVPDNALARAFRDHAGRLNQAIAARADRALFIAAGLPLILK